MNIFPKPQRVDQCGGQVCWSRLAGFPPSLDLPTTTNNALEQFVATHSNGFVSRADEQTAPFLVDLDHPGSQAYVLDIHPEGVRLSASDPAGLAYGLDTLAQILASSSAPLECIRIEDAPDFSRRGFMWDVSRCKVPTMETAFALIDLLARGRTEPRRTDPRAPYGPTWGRTHALHHR